MSGFEVRLSEPGLERRRRWGMVLLILALPLAFALGLVWAQWRAPASEVQQGDTQTLLTRLFEQEQELEFLRQRLVVVDSGKRVDQQSIEQTRRTIKLLEEQIFKQQQDLAFYKGVLAPGSRREGLRIRTFELQPLENPRHFRYKLLLSRVGKDEAPLQGKLRITVEGEQDGKAVSLDLNSLSDELSEVSIPFSFKHFQSFPEGGRFGVLQLPEGLVPRQVKVRAEVEGDKPLNRTFEWINEE